MWMLIFERGSEAAAAAAARIGEVAAALEASAAAIGALPAVCPEECSVHELGFWALAFSSAASADTPLAVNPPPPRHVHPSTRPPVQPPNCPPLQGLTGYGAQPGCAVVRQWQRFSDPADELSVQTVEVVASSFTGAHALAALKGGWSRDGERLTERCICMYEDEEDEDEDDDDGGDDDDDDDA